MAVSERLMARVFGLQEPFVEVRLFHSPVCALPTALLFGLFETAALPQFASSLGEKLRSWRWDSQTKAIVQYLLSPEVPIAKKQALWSQENVVFTLESEIHGVDQDFPDEEQLKSDIKEHFDLQICDYSEGPVSSDSATLYMGLLHEKVALLYPDFSSDSFSACSCGYLYYHFGVYAKYQAQAGMRAVSLPQFQSNPINCLNCGINVGYRRFAQLAEEPLYRGVAIQSIHMEILSEDPLKRHMESSQCLTCAGRLRTRSGKGNCDCGRICWNCIVISSLQKSQFECPACGECVSHTETWDILNDIRGKIVGLEGLKELPLPIRTEVHRSPPKTSLCGRCKRGVGSISKPCGCLFCPACVESVTESCPNCSKPLMEGSVKAVTSEKVWKVAEMGLCRCGKRIKSNGVYCEKHCVCGGCLLRHYLQFRVLQCPTCSGDTFGLIPLDVLCSMCCKVLSPMEASVLKHPSAICTCGAILCCFCLQIKDDGFICPICNAPLELLDPVLEVESLRTHFRYGCYCGEVEVATVRMPCSHMMHEKCLGYIITCRLCGKKVYSRPKPKLFDDYIV